MAIDETINDKAGFQRSETSRCIVTIHAFGDEIGLPQNGPQRIRIAGLRDGEERDGPSLVSCQTSKTLGTAAGQFSFDVKARRRDDFDMLNAVMDEDWVDISMTRHDSVFHVMRGLIDDVRRVTAVVNGVTTEVFRISGRDFGKIFEVTPIYFNPMIEGELALAGGAMFQILERAQSFLGPPDSTVQAVLAGFLRQLAGIGRGTWELPPSLAVVGRAELDPDNSLPEGEPSTFLDNCFFYSDDFTGVPDRGNTMVGNEFTPHNSIVWAFANSWSDQPLTELYVDLLGQNAAASTVTETDDGFPTLDPGPVYLGGPNGEIVESDPSSTVMSVVFRDRPFPTFANESFGVDESPWFTTIPTHEVNRESIAALDVGRSGTERKNAFLISSQLIQELVKAHTALQIPLWSDRDIRRHGLRLHDVTSRYAAEKPNLFTVTSQYREIVRDFHCMNHLFLSGTVALGVGRPDIRVGGRFRILGKTPDLQETYYVESVGHSWDYLSGVKTTATLTRGWMGDDRSLIDAMSKVIAEYEPAMRASRG